MSASGQLDFKRAFDATIQDPSWARKCIMAGLPILIPVVGWVAMLGWQRRRFERARAGRDDLPEPSLGEDLAQGVDPAIAMLNAMPFVLLAVALTFGIPFLMMLLGALLSEASKPLGGLVAIGATMSQLLGMALWFVLVSIINLASPELLRRAFLGERFPLFNPTPSLRIIRDNLNDFVVVLVLTLLANILAGFGIYLCCVGFVLTRPIAAAFQAHLLGQWQARLDARDGPAPAHTAPEKT